MCDKLKDKDHVCMCKGNHPHLEFNISVEELKAAIELADKDGTVRIKVVQAGMGTGFHAGQPLSNVLKDITDYSKW